MSDFLRIPYQSLHDVFLAILLQQGLTTEKAQLCAKVFSQNSLDGVYTHGVNRFPRFIQYIKAGYVKIHEDAVVQNRKNYPGMDQTIEQIINDYLQSKAEPISGFVIPESQSWRFGTRTCETVSLWHNRCGKKY